jgi:vacuolar-type H+-ATPase subunit E/Vma4
MALSDILVRILEEAGEQASEIRARGEGEAKKILAEARREADALRKKLILKGEEALRRELGNDISAARLRARKEVLALKRNLLAEVLERVPAFLHEMPAGEYARLLADLVDEEAAALPGILESGSGDIARFGEEFPSLVGEILARKHPGCRVAPSPLPGSFEQGIVIRTERVVHNLSLHVLLHDARGRLEAEVAQVLFAP